MIYNFASKKLFALLKEKGEFVEEGRKLSAEIEKLQKELNKCGLGIQRLSEKMQPIVTKLMKPIRKEMDEFEEIGQFKIADEAPNNDEIVVETFNVVDAFKDSYREQKKQDKQNK